MMSVAREMVRSPFLIKADQKVVFDSGEMKCGDAPKNVDLIGVKKLELIVDSLGSNASDHAVWAAAKFVYNHQLPEMIDPDAEYVPESYYPPVEKHCVAGEKVRYFIDSNKGDDLNSGLSQNKPWRTLAKVNHLVLSAGNIITNAPGKYDHTLAPKGGGTLANPAVIRLLPGKYEFSPTQALSRKYQISNTNDDPNTPKPIALAFEECANIRIVGDKNHGSEIIIHGKMIEASVVNSNNITFENLAFDYQRPTMSEYRIEKVGDRFAKIKIHPESRYQVRNQTLFWVGDGWELRAPEFT